MNVPDASECQSTVVLRLCHRVHCWLFYLPTIKELSRGAFLGVHPSFPSSRTGSYPTNSVERRVRCIARDGMTSGTTRRGRPHVERHCRSATEGSHWTPCDSWLDRPTDLKEAPSISPTCAGRSPLSLNDCHPALDRSFGPRTFYVRRRCR